MTVLIEKKGKIIMKCKKCNSENTRFMDNSFALFAHMWSDPIEQCLNCGCIHIDNLDGNGMVIYDLTKEQFDYFTKCFNDYYRIKEELWMQFKSKNPKTKRATKLWLEELFGYDYVGAEPKCVSNMYTWL